MCGHIKAVQNDLKTKGRHTSTMAKTREEIIADYQSEFIDVLGMEVTVDGFDEVIKYNVDMDPMPEKIHVILPEHSTYHLVIHYKVKERPIKQLHYYHAVKKAGIPIKTRSIELGDVDPNTGDTYHIAKFEPDTLPGGMFIRGTYPANSIFLEAGKPIFSFDWSIEIAKKDVKPSMKV